MRVVVLNASPKGARSVTMQYVRFLRQERPQDAFERVDVALHAARYEHDDAALARVCDAVRGADAVLWAFPLYFFLVCSQAKRFIELVFERGHASAFEGRYAASLSTSIHAMDHVAHRYVNAVCDDLGMRWHGEFSADMYDLLEPEEQRRLLAFADAFLEAARLGHPTIRRHAPLAPVAWRYAPGPSGPPLALAGRRVTIVHDARPEDANLGRMVAALARRLGDGVEVVDLNGVRIQGGCLGCMRCAYDARCVYTGKDEFAEFFERALRGADAIVLAGTIRDRYLSSRWKLFFDRSFFNNHTPSLQGRQVALLVSGPLGQLPHLRDAIQAWAEFQRANFAGAASDESGDAAGTDSDLTALALRVADGVARGYVAPRTFLGVGLAKVFRDDVFGRLRFPFLADDRNYRALGLYDFPQRQVGVRVRNAAMSLLMRSARLRDRVYRRELLPGMLRPFERLFERDD